MSPMNEHYPPSADAPPVTPQRKEDTWARDMLAHIALEGIREQRSARRWGIFIKLTFLAYLIAVLAVFSLPGIGSGELITTGPHTGVVEVRGIIATDTEASADKVIAGLRDAFEHQDSKGVVVYIDSPGGSPVEAGRINTEMQHLREKHPDKQLYAVIGELCASGGYYVAAGAEHIYADKASLVGSIGVLFSSFGFVQAIEKLGVERRLLTAGEHKGLLDPFLNQSDKEVKHLQGILDTIHQQFISVVEAGRGDRLTADDELYSGLIWTGEQGLSMGLVDALGDVDHVASEVIKAKKIVDYSHRDAEDFFNRFLVRAGRALGAGFFSGVLGHGTPL